MIAKVLQMWQAAVKRFAAIKRVRYNRTWLPVERLEERTTPATFAWPTTGTIVTSQNFMAYGDYEDSSSALTCKIWKGSYKQTGVMTPDPVAMTWSAVFTNVPWDVAYDMSIVGTQEDDQYINDVDVSPPFVSPPDWRPLGNEGLAALRVEAGKAPTVTPVNDRPSMDAQALVAGLDTNLISALALASSLGPVNVQGAVWSSPADEFRVERAIEALLDQLNTDADDHRLQLATGLDLPRPSEADSAAWIAFPVEFGGAQESVR